MFACCDILLFNFNYLEYKQSDLITLYTEWKGIYKTIEQRENDYRSNGN